MLFLLYHPCGVGKFNHHFLFFIAFVEKRLIVGITEPYSITTKLPHLCSKKAGFA
jgi:hypothetical protein